MLNVNKSEYYPRVVVVKDIDPYTFKTSQDVFHVLKQMRIGIISYVELDYEVTCQGEQTYARVHFEKWNKTTTMKIRDQLENGKSVDILSLGYRAYMVDYQRLDFIRKEEEQRIRKQREEEKRLKKQKEEERRIRKQKEEEERHEQQRRNREAAEMFEMENKYVNDASIINDLDINYGDEETLFFKFNTKTGNIDYKGRQYVIYT